MILFVSREEPLGYAGNHKKELETFWYTFISHVVLAIV
jgi:hypothetical protein